MMQDASQSAGRFDYEAYLKDFNTNDDEVNLPRWFTEDFVFERHPLTTIHGRDAWLASNKILHDGVREILTLHSYVQEGNLLAAEVTTRFVAIEDRPDHPVGRLMAGESRAVRLFAFYTLRDGKVCGIRMGAWPPEDIQPA